MLQIHLNAHMYTVGRAYMYL